MNPLLYVLPFCVIYAAIRGVMYYRSGRKMWMIQMIIFGSFLTCIWLYELWLMLSADR